MNRRSFIKRAVAAPVAAAAPALAGGLMVGGHDWWDVSFRPLPSDWIYLNDGLKAQELSKGPLFTSTKILDPYDGHWREFDWDAAPGLAGALA